MTRLESILSGEEDGPYASYLWDIRRMKDAIPSIRNLPTTTVGELYSRYSDMYAAGWMRVDDDMICGFAGWLETEVG